MLVEDLELGVNPKDMACHFSIWQNYTYSYFFSNTAGSTSNGNDNYITNQSMEKKSVRDAMFSHFGWASSMF